MARDVFISYRNEDKEAAQRVCAVLEHENISCWMAPRDIPVGKEWATAIVEGLQRCRAFLLVLSSNSKSAKQISREAELADNQGIPIFTFRIEDVQPPPGLLYFLGNIQWLDAFGGQFDSALSHLTEVIKQSDSYPAEKTTIRPVPTTLLAQQPAVKNFAQPVVTPAAAAPPPPVYVPAWSDPSNTVATRDSRSIWIVAAAVVVVMLALGGWFAFRPHKPAPTPSYDDGKAFPHRKPLSEEAEVKAVADRFLTERDSGDYDSAWGEYSSSFRKSLDKAQWTSTLQEIKRKNGEVQKRISNGCSLERTDRYICDYTLVFANGTQQDNRLTVVKNSEGQWVISGGALKQLQSQ